MTVKIEELLERDGKIMELTVGGSMRPMLKNRSNPIVIERVSRDLRINDIVLFKRQQKYVLHRIIKHVGDDFIIRGDNCYDNEYVSNGQIIGILSGFYKGDKYVDCQTDFWYKVYVIVWRFIYPLRFCIKKTWDFGMRVLSFIKRRILKR